MKLIFSLILTSLVFSCGSSFSNVSDNQSQIAEIDCTEKIKDHIMNNQGLITNSTETYQIKEVIKQKDGSYKAKLIWVTGQLPGSIFGKQIWTNNSCEVTKVK